MKARSSDWYKHGWTLDIKNQSWTENTSAQVDFIIKALELKGNERILDLACGYGRHSLEFARRGYEVVGVDITPVYVEDANMTAKKEELNASFFCRDIRDVEFQNEFDVVLSLGDGAVGYLENDYENSRIFDVIAKALKTGGKNFMDLQNGDYADAHYPQRIWEAGKKELTLSQFEWNKETRILLYGQRDFAYETVLEKPEMNEGDPTRLYTKSEIESLFKERGMSLWKAYGNWTLEEVNEGHSQMLLCGQKM